MRVGRGQIETKQRSAGARASLALLLLATAWLALAPSATAELSGNYAKFAACPFENPKASKCIYTETVGGEVVLGATKVPIVNPATLQGAYARPGGDTFSEFIAATDGQTLSKAPQPIPGGLLGIVAPPDASPLVKAVIALLFENDLTDVSASLELAKPPSQIRFSEEHLGGELETALSLPLKIQLESPFLGPDCHVGSASSPVVWNLTSGATAPPKPAKPISGTAGAFEVAEGGKVLEGKGAVLVDNAWAIPAASGCGGPLSSLIDPIVNGIAKLPAPAGKSLVSLENDAFIASAESVKQNDAAGGG